MHGDRVVAGPGRLLARPLMAGLAAVGLAAMLAGCGNGVASVALPKKPALAHLAAVPPAPQSASQLVLAAYEGYWRATSLALDSRSPAKAKKILAGYVPGSAVPGLVKGMGQLWRADEVQYGSPVFHVMSVMMTGSQTAAVHDCIDLSHSGFANKQTGQIIGGLGQSHEYLITTLALERGRWLITGAVPVVRPCAY